MSQHVPSYAYRTFFVLGISLLPVGIATNPAFIGAGAAFFIIGLAGLTRQRSSDDA